MNYWLINPKSEGSETDLTNEQIDCVFMGWGKDSCPKFYNDVKNGDVVIVAEKAHSNSKVHYIGIADILDEQNQCWNLKYSSKEKNEEVEKIIHKSPSDFGGGDSKNPWGPTKSIIKVTNNPAEKKLKEQLKSFFKEKKMEKYIADYKNLLLNAHNLILHGAPGTGKTHLAKQIAAAMGCTDTEIGFVQFHPSYDYTDFVEGLRPVQNADGQIGFERRNGVFKEFCARALENLNGFSEDNFDEVYKKLLDKIEEADEPLIYETLTHRKKFSLKPNSLRNIYAIPDTESQTHMPITKENLRTYLRTSDTLGWKSYVTAIAKHLVDEFGYKKTQSNHEKPFLFIIDEINRGEISKIFGELFFSIDPGYRGEKGKISTQYQNLIDADDAFADGFFVPENVYIIGTMNDIDRSVESMDFAFRRRFTFCEIKANDSLGMLDGLDDSIREEAKTRLLHLNDAISKTEGLSSAYHIGGAYFLKLKELGNDFAKLWDYHLEGLLREYLRGMEDVDALLADLKAAYENPAEQEVEPQ